MTIPGLSLLTPYLVWIKVGVVALVVGGAGVAGWTARGWKCDAAETHRVASQFVLERTLREKVPVIVTKTVTQDVTIEKEVPHVIEIIRRETPRDCVLPDPFGRLLVDSARRLDGEGASSPDETSGTYDCDQVLEAVTKDLAAGKRNGVRLTGLQEHQRLMEDTK